MNKSRSRRLVLFCKKGVLKNFAKFKGKHLCQNFFLIKLQTTAWDIIKKRLRHRCFLLVLQNFWKEPFCRAPQRDWFWKTWVSSTKHKNYKLHSPTSTFTQDLVSAKKKKKNAQQIQNCVSGNWRSYLAKDLWWQHWTSAVCITQIVLRSFYECFRKFFEVSVKQ